MFAISKRAELKKNLLPHHQEQKSKFIYQSKTDQQMKSKYKHFFSFIKKLAPLFFYAALTGVLAYGPEITRFIMKILRSI